MRILLSAYACEPDRGSEPHVGLQALLAAASRHDVWALTRSNNVGSLERYLRGHPLAERVHVVGIDLSERARDVKKKTGIAGMYWYYNLWQRLAERRAGELDRDVDFHLAHHITFATYWARAGVSALPKPMVWGPVGGGVVAPLRLSGELGPRGLVSSALRSATQRFAEHTSAVRDAMSRASVAIAQNPETAARLSRCHSVQILPNGAAADVWEPPAQSRSDHIVAFVGRLVPYKACVLAVRTMRHVTDPRARLVIFGAGPERSRIERRIRRWGLQGRVEFAGMLSRPQVLREIGRSAVLLHPALHEESGLAVAEALSLGTPVVCLDRGGPPLLASLWDGSPSVAVRPSSPESTARQMAEAIDGYLASPAAVPDEVIRPNRSFADAVLEAYEKAVAIGRPDLE